jgi:hypothetical protein
MDVEDDVPDGLDEFDGGRARGPRQAMKVPPWLVLVQLAGYLVAVVLFLAMAGPTRTAVDTRAAYDTAPVCTVGGAQHCGPNDDTRETISVTGSTQILGGKNQQQQGIILNFTDPSGQLPSAASANFSGDDTPPLDSATGAGQQFAAEVWRGELMWVAAVGDPGGDRYYADLSVEHTTKFTLVAPAVVGGIDFLCCCFGWWLLVRRGWVSDRGSFRPVYALACLIVIGFGWELLARTESSGVAVMGAGLVLSALLGLPLPKRAWLMARADRMRSLRARPGKPPGRNEIFR